MSPKQATTLNRNPATPPVAPSLGQIGVDIEALALAQLESRYSQLLAAAQTSVRPRQSTEFHSRLIGTQTVTYRPSTYLTVSNNSQSD